MSIETHLVSSKANMGSNKSESGDTRALHWAFHDAERGRGALATLVISSGRGL